MVWVDPWFGVQLHLGSIHILPVVSDAAMIMGGKHLSKTLLSVVGVTPGGGGFWTTRQIVCRCLTPTWPLKDRGDSPNVASLSPPQCSLLCPPSMCVSYGTWPTPPQAPTPAEGMGPSVTAPEGPVRAGGPESASGWDLLTTGTGAHADTSLAVSPLCGSIQRLIVFFPW